MALGRLCIHDPLGFFPPLRPELVLPPTLERLLRRGGGGACPCNAAGGLGMRFRVGLLLFRGGGGLFRRGGSLGRPDAADAEAGSCDLSAAGAVTEAKPWARACGAEAALDFFVVFDA